MGTDGHRFGNLIFSANLSMMFAEHDFLSRIGAARDAGFVAVEFQFPYDVDAADLGRTLARHGLAVSIFNLPPGDWDAGERGLSALPGRQDAFAASIERALPYAAAVAAQRVHVMAGIPGAAEGAREIYLENLALAADRFAEVGLDLLIEPINPRDMPGYFLTSAAQAAEILEELGRPNTRLLFDIYHHQIVCGDVCKSLERYLPLIGHVQLAGVPDRHEPDRGELNIGHILGHLDRLGYRGHVGCEYRPVAGTLDGLGWLDRLAV